MRQDVIYCSSVEIMAISDIHKINFVIYTENVIVTTERYAVSKTPAIISRKPHSKNIMLLITGNLECWHYELLEEDTPVK